MPELVAVCSFAVVGATWGYLVLWPGRRSPRLLRAGPLRRAVRWWRQLLLRAGAATASWPHLLDVARGVGRTPVAPTPSEAVGDVGIGVVRRYRADRRGGARGTPTRAPVVVVHSVITEPWVLDLTPDRSLVADLIEAGHEVFLVDWKPVETRADGATRDLARHVAAIDEAVRLVVGQTGAATVDVVGYCLGGTLAAAWAARRPAPLGRLVLVAPVGDTRVAGEQGVGMARLLASPLLQPAFFLDHRCRVPGPLVREAFHVLRPMAITTVRSWGLARGDASSARFYGAMSRWTWEQRDLAGALFFDLVRLYRESALLAGSLVVEGDPVDVARISVPTLVACAARDHLVPPPSSWALADRIGAAADVVACPGGHVSMMVGSSGASTLRPAVRDFLAGAGPTIRVGTRPAGGAAGRSF